MTDAERNPRREAFDANLAKALGLSITDDGVLEVLAEHGPSLLNPFEKAKVDCEANLIALLGTGGINRDEVPEHLRDEFDDINRPLTKDRTYFDVVDKLGEIARKYDYPEEDERLSLYQKVRVRTLRDTLRQQLDGVGMPIPGALITKMAAAKADLYRIDHGAMSMIHRPAVDGKLAVYEWMLGRTESIDVLAEPDIPAIIETLTAGR